MTEEQAKEFDDLFYKTGCEFGDKLSRQTFDKEIVGSPEYKFMLKMMIETHNKAVRKCAETFEKSEKRSPLAKSISNVILKNLISPD